MKCIKILFSMFLIGFFSLSVFAQTQHESIHQIQHNKYKNQQFQEEIPGLAKGYVPLRQRADSNTVYKEVLGFHPYWQGTDWQYYQWDLLTTVAYFGADINFNGNFTNTHSWPVNSLINTAHANGVRVVLVGILFNSSSIATLLNSATYRQNLINNLVNAVQSAGADGVNIDFEGMPGGQRSNFVTFMSDLTEAFHSNIPGSQVTVDMPAVDWSNNFNLNGLANACDGLMIMGYDYHWSSSTTTGPVAPLTGGSINVQNTMTYYLTNTNQNRSKLILGVPYYGYQWPASSSEPGATTTGTGTAKLYDTAEGLAASYGKMRYAPGGEIPWYRYGSDTTSWTQGWYDDSLSLSLKYELALGEDIQGIGIWALGYDGDRTELWGALADHFLPDSIPPHAPEDFCVTHYRGGTAANVSVSEVPRATRYKLYTSTDGETFSLLEEFYNPDVLVSGFPTDRITYLKVSAVNEAGESPTTETLAFVPGPDSPRALIVNGFDRVAGTLNTHDFVRQHGPAIWHRGIYFDAASNEAVVAGEVDLNSYDMVDWILGEEGTSTSSFTPSEQTIVADYLENGGSFFVSGSEIGYDLVASGDSADSTFYSDYLKAIYVSDAAGYPHAFFPAGSSVFDGIGTVNFDDGTHGTYDVDYPDGIKPADGAEIALKYDGNDYDTQGGAGIVYTGTFGSGSATSRLVYISPGFETIYPGAARDSVMADIVNYFQIAMDVTGEPTKLPAKFALESAYPNPFNSTVNIRYYVPYSTGSKITLSIYDLLGRKVYTLYQGHQSEGSYTLQWTGINNQGENVASGTYLVVGQYQNSHQVIKITYLK